MRRYRRTILAGLLMVVATMLASFQIPPLTRKAVDALAFGAEARELAELRWWSYALGFPSPADADLVAEIEERGAYGRVVRYVLLICAAAAAGAVIRVRSRTMLFNAGRNVERDLRADYYRHLQTLDPPFYERRAVGDLMSRATNDLGNVRLLLGPGILSVTNFAVAYALALTMMSRISWELLVYALLPFPLVMLLVRAYASRLYEHSKAVQEGLSDLVSKVEENLQGIGVVKSYALEESELAAFDRLNTEYYDRSRKLVISRGLMFPLMGSLGSIGLFIVIWVGGRKVIGGQMTLGQFVEFNQYLAALAWPTAAMGWVMGLFQRGVASLGRLNQIFEEEPVIRDLGDEDPEPVRGRIEVRNLNFRYEGERAFGLENISLTVEPGQTVALVGPTASGKTTFMRLLTRMLPLGEGQIFVDGRDITHVPMRKLRRRMGVAPQEAFLFSATLRDNLVFGRDGGGMEAEEAARAAGLHKDVEQLRAGYDTMIGERGVTLSGGQRQRAALARALAVRPEILILDDSLSAIDTATEEEILEGLREIRKGRTALIVSHRLSSVQDADRIVVLDHGRIVDQGRHEELVARGGLYARLFHQQQITRELEAL